MVFVQIYILCRHCLFSSFAPYFQYQYLSRILRSGKTDRQREKKKGAADADAVQVQVQVRVRNPGPIRGLEGRGRRPYPAIHEKCVAFLRLLPSLRAHAKVIHFHVYRFQRKMRNFPFPPSSPPDCADYTARPSTAWHIIFWM